MKRWQNRGEVSDSDDEDEELSLGTISQSPERPTKRPNLGHQNQEGHEITNLEELHSSNQNGQDQADSGQVALPGEPATSPGEAERSGNELKYLSHVAISSPATNISEYAEAREYASSATTSTPLKALEGGTSSTLATSPLQAAELKPIPGHAEVDSFEAAHIAELSSGLSSPLSSAPSSPLSERANSPPAPPDLLSRLQPLASRANLYSEATSEQCRSDKDLFNHSLGFHVSSLGEHAAVESVGNASNHGQQQIEQMPLGPEAFSRRRNFRTRQEKQLHPYLFDQALYQKQCRERGMRPVRILDQGRRAPETQDAFSVADEPASQMHSSPASSPPEPVQSDEQSRAPRRNVFEEHLARLDFDMSSSQSDASVQSQRQNEHAVTTSVKRRKLSHVFKKRMDDTINSQSQNEPHSVPTPPPTSSDSGDARGNETAVRTFRMPLGMTPLTTPGLQSHTPARTQLRRRLSDSSDDMQPVQDLNQNGQSRIIIPSPTPESSESSSEAEAPSDSNVEESRLQTQRRRIRGVLPASWLRLDLQAQETGKALPSKRLHHDPVSSTGISPQKGVARVIARPNSASRPPASNTIVIDNESEASDSDSGLAVSNVEHRAASALDMSTSETLDFGFDDDIMEVDRIDPMLAHNSRTAQQRSKPRRALHQPRIKDALVATRDRYPEASTEERAFALPRKKTSARTRRDKVKTSDSRPHKRASGPPLSIIDASIRTNGGDAQVPQFVRLAQRNARKQRSYGRHSPSQKHIRLATLEDTEDATSVLRDWREGTIVPTEQRQMRSKRNKIDLTRLDNETLPETDSLLGGGIVADFAQSHGQGLHSTGHRNQSEKTRQIQAKVRRPQQRQNGRRLANVTSRRTSEMVAPERAALGDDLRGDKGTQRPKSSTARPAHPEAQYRQGQIETLEKDFVHDHRSAAFARRIFCLTENVARRSFTPGIKDTLPLERFIRNHEDNDEQVDEISGDPAVDDYEMTPQATRSFQQLPHRQRKRLTRHVDADARNYRQPSEPIPEPPGASIQPEHDFANPVLQGLGPSGTRYATTFDVSPLQIGTYFHQTSFIGSGEFASSLELAGRDLSLPLGRIRIHIGGNVIEWGPWNEEVSSQLSQIPKALSDVVQTLRDAASETTREEQQATVEANLDHVLRSTIRYFSKCLSFIDAIDRSACVPALSRLIKELVEYFIDEEACALIDPPLRARCILYATVLAHQAYLLSRSPTVPATVQDNCRKDTIACAHKLIASQAATLFKDLRNFYESNKLALVREKGIRDTDVAISSVVVLHHVLNTLDPSSHTFWEVLRQRIFEAGINTLDNVATLDRTWYAVFSILPLLEIDSSGIARLGRRLRGNGESCSLVKEMITRLLDMYPASTLQHETAMEAYVQANFVRCHHLITSWGWWRSESLLRALFDFFARRGLMQLNGEQSHGPPRFLSHLPETPTLDVDPEERSFHIFLKTLGASLLGMARYKVYPDKKIGSIAWRFIPNHGRTYRKDAEVRQEDIDALRNHHALLCTLYYASPPQYRLRISVLSNLVNHSMSHREACGLSVEAWSNVATFQASTEEPLERLDPICEWFRDILDTTMKQYHLARSEVEQEVASARATGTVAVSNEMIEATIARNQRQIVATLFDTISSLKKSLLCAPKLGVAVHLLRDSKFWHVFDLFDASTRRLDATLEAALEVITTAMDLENLSDSRIESQVTSEDSQDFGDSSALQEFAATQMPEAVPQRIAHVLHEPFGRFVSNVFGDDLPGDGTLLSKIIDVWVRLVGDEVQQGDKIWSSYINGYSSNSWSQLRDTEQKRKFTPYFLHRVMQQGDYSIIETDILAYWLKSLVEREAMLKYQHLLTESLLNSESGSPLFRNLPFSRNSQSKAFSVSLEQFRQGRLGLISSILANMRYHIDSLQRSRSSRAREVRRSYGDLLQQLMHTMKDNYLEVQAVPAAESHDNQIQGTYVTFVQHVVSSLQQYTASIQAVDEFFTDSSAFPLPARDPTYVVGKLKSYVPKLAENGTRKQLLAFFHSLCERAAVDNQQQYLVDQLTTAMTDVVENGDTRAPTLRYVMCTAIFPAFVENALKTSASWLWTLPILDAWGNILKRLLYDVVMEDEASIAAALSSIDSLLVSVEHPIKTSLTHPGLVALPHVQRVLSSAFDALRKSLTLCQHISTATEVGLTTKMARLAILSKGIETCIHDPSSYETWCSEFDEWFDAATTPWPETRSDMRNEVQRALEYEWEARDGQYFLRKKNFSREVVVHHDDEKEEKARLLASLGRFQKSYEIVFLNRQRAPEVSIKAGNAGAADLDVANVMF